VLQRFAELADDIQRVAAIADGGLDGFMVHAAEFRRRFLEDLFGALLDGEIIVAANQKSDEL